MIILISAIVVAIIWYGFYRWKIGKIKVHYHCYSKPIVSKYIFFNARDIVYECRCGERKIIRVYRPFNELFPIQTTNLITHQELEKIANEKEY